VADADAPERTKLVPLKTFKDFVRRVVAVPKGEIDRRLEAERRRRATAKK